MQIIILSKEQQPQYAQDIFAMLAAADNEFVPPLSARSSTTQADLSPQASGNDGVSRYFEQMKDQRLLVAEENGELLAFVSFREDYTCDVITENELPNIYISTLIVKPEGRGKGLTRKMYGALFEQYKTANVFTRTWSTNLAHIKILSGFGFETLHTIKDHRGVGIDTVYFVKRKD